MKKSQVSKLVLGLFGAITMALSFSGCAELANAFAGKPAFLKVVANSGCEGKYVDVYLRAVKADGETFVNDQKYCEYNLLGNGAKRDISECLPNNTLAGEQYVVYARYRSSFETGSWQKIKYGEPAPNYTDDKYASIVGGDYDVVIKMYSPTEIRWTIVYNPNRT
ncbi:MAG: hypothetical protein IKP60_01635 [Treponema sp.]|nr:hypothetical protein [Treponema sp.]